MGSRRAFLGTFSRRMSLKNSTGSIIKNLVCQRGLGFSLESKGSQTQKPTGARELRSIRVLGGLRVSLKNTCPVYKNSFYSASVF